MSEDTKKDNESHDNFQVGDRVKHPKFGDGQIIQRSGSGDQAKLVVTFVEEGEKKLMVRYANLKKLHPIASEEQKAAPEAKPKPAPASIPTRKRAVDLDEDEEEKQGDEAEEGEDFEVIEAAEGDEDFEFEDAEEPIADEEEEKE